MNKADALSVAGNMHTASGLFWPTPVLNLVESAGGNAAGDRIALRDPNVEGNPVLAIMEIDTVEEFQMRKWRPLPRKFTARPIPNIPVSPHLTVREKSQSQAR